MELKYPSAFHCVLGCRSVMHALVKGDRCICANEGVFAVPSDDCTVTSTGTHIGGAGSSAVYRCVHCVLTHVS